MPFESVWIKQWLLAIILRDKYPHWIIELQEKMKKRLLERFPDIEEICLTFFTKALSPVPTIARLLRLNFVEIERLLVLIHHYQPPQVRWATSAYQANAKLLLFASLSNHNLSAALRLHHLLKHGEWILHNSNMHVDESLWHIFKEVESIANRGNDNTITRFLSGAGMFAESAARVFPQTSSTENPTSASLSPPVPAAATAADVSTPSSRSLSLSHARQGD